MKVAKMLTAIVATVVLANLDSPAHATVSNFTVTVGGQNVGNTVNTDSSTNVQWMDISGSYPSGITIASNSGGPCDAQNRTNCARVEADDITNDKFSIKNAKITFTQPVTNYTITATGTFQPGPTTSATNPVRDVTYQLSLPLSLPGTLMRGGAGAATDKVYARGEVRYPAGSGSWWWVGDSDLYKYISLTSYNFYISTLSKNWGSSNTLNADRDLRLTLWFTRTNTSGTTDTLIIPGYQDSDDALQLAGIPAAGGHPSGRPIDPKTLPIAESNMEGVFGQDGVDTRPCRDDAGWWCRVLGIACPLSGVREECPTR
jgi:hypothetical protein